MVARAASQRCNDAQHLAEPLLRFIYNAIGAPVGAGVLYPAFRILLSPTIAAMAVSSVSVVVNALRLRRLRL